jgi:hypothetical protein
MFRRKQTVVIIFNEERYVSLHMYFVFYPIDVLILDRNKRIVEITRNFRPFTFWNSTKKGKYVIELAEQGDYAIGDTLVFSELIIQNNSQIR